MNLAYCKTTLLNLFFIVYFPFTTLAQVVPDKSLPNNSEVVLKAGILHITEGTILGSNLFHSFSQFSLLSTDNAFFDNNLTINNIFARVTGTEISNINGLIKVNGNANLFLINPRGIIFNSKSKLDIGGSFIASTAESVLFDDGRSFSVIESDSIPLLSSKIPLGLRFGDYSSTIINRSQSMQMDVNGSETTVGLQVKPGRTLALIGGEVRLERGQLTTAAGTIDLSNVGATLVGKSILEQNTQLTGGQIEIGAVGENSLVNIFQSPDNSQIFSFDYSLVDTFHNLSLSQLAVIDASGNGGGAIHIRGKNITLREGSLIKSNTLGENPGQPITIHATGSLEVFGNILVNDLTDPRFAAAGIIIPRKTSVSTTSFSKGRAGDINVEAENVIVDSGAEIAAFSFGEGRGGDISLKVTDSSVIEGQSIPLSFIPERFFSFGLDVPGFKGASFRAAAMGSSVSASSAGPGDAGNIFIQTKFLRIRDGAFVATNPLFDGNGGTITVNATESVEVSGTSKYNILPDSLDISPSLLWTAATGSGNAKSLSINTKKLFILDGGTVQSTTFASGNAGDLFINASEYVEVSGVGLPTIDGELPSSLRASSYGSGNAGNLNIKTNKVVIGGGANISVAAVGRSTGLAGNLTINANSISLNRGFITAEIGKTGIGEGANIRLQLSEILRLENESLISATAFGNSNGGNIFIDPLFLLAFPSTTPNGSDIIAKAQTGSGGRIFINTKGIFGISKRLAIPDNQSNDIDASSQFGSSGIVQINTIINPNQGLIEIPVTVVDPNYLVSQNLCRRNSSSEFTVSGRGGLPSSVSDELSSESTLIQLVEPVQNISEKQNNLSSHIKTIPLTSVSAPIAPAQGWVFNSIGQVVLVDYNPIVSGVQRLKSTLPGCPI